MKRTTYGLLKASTLAIALLGSAAVIATVAAPDFAHAKEGKGNGGGNGGGNGKGGDGGGKGASGNGGGKGVDKGRSGSKAGKSTSRSGKSKSERAGSKKGGGFSLKDLFRGKNKSGTTASTKKSTTTKVSKQKTKTYKAPSKTAVVEDSVHPSNHKKGDRIADLLGAHPSELGALNAANASATALANAAPNSRVGRIAAYRDTVLEGDALREELAEQLAELEGLEPPERSVAEIEDDLAATLDDVQSNQERVEELEQELEDAGGADPEIEEQLDEARTDLENSVQDAQDLTDERQAALDYQETVDETQELAERVEQQELTEREALEAAANKPVTDAVEAEVKSLLGLSPEDTDTSG